MATTPIIQIGQTTVSGTEGESVDFLQAGTVVQASDVANLPGSTSFSWELVGPTGVDVYLTNSGTNPVEFIPPVAGTYLLYLDVAGGTYSSYEQDYIGQKISSQGGAAILFDNGMRAPGHGETTQFNSGWDHTMYEFIKDVDTDLGYASYLRTSTGTVLVSGTEPSEGQLLAADSSTTASWQDPYSLTVKDDGTTVSGSVSTIDFVGEGVTATVSGSEVRVEINATGGGGSGTDSRDYLYAGLSSNQTTNIGDNDHIEYDSYGSRGNSITMSSNGIFTLQPGTYKISVSTRVNANEGWFTFQLSNNADDSVLVGVNSLDAPFQVVYDNNRATDNSSNHSIIFIFETESEVSIKNMITGGSARQYIRSSSHILIEEF